MDEEKEGKLPEEKPEPAVNLEKDGGKDEGDPSEPKPEEKQPEEKSEPAANLAKDAEESPDDKPDEFPEDNPEPPAENPPLRDPLEDSHAKKKHSHLSAAARKKLRYGTVATVITCAVTAIVIVVNVIVSRLVDTHPLKIDLTENQIYDISQDSIDFLENMTEDVDFTVLMSESSFQTTGVNMKMVQETLERYTQYTDKIHLSYVDPASNPDVVNRYQEYYTASLTEGDIVVSLTSDPSRLRVVSVNNLFSYDEQKYYALMYGGQGTLEDCITGFSGEQNLTAALMFVTDADPVTVGFCTTANGGELFNTSYYSNSLAMFVQTLTKNGYDVKLIDLYTDDLDPSVYDMLVLPAPVNDVTAEGIENLSNFLYNEGAYDRNLVYFADFSQSATPRLDEFLASWGIEVGTGTLMEGDTDSALQVTVMIGSQSVPVNTPSVTMDDEDYQSGVANSSLPIAAPSCRPIRLLWESRSAGITESLLKTSDSVYLNASDLEEGEEPDITPLGAQTVAAVSSRGLGDFSAESSIMVLGSVLLADYNLLQDASYNNSPFLVSAVNQITGKDEGLVISEKELTNKTLSMTAGDAQMSIFAVFAIPAAVVITGVIVLVRRRNK